MKTWMRFACLLLCAVLLTGCVPLSSVREYTSATNNREQGSNGQVYYDGSVLYSGGKLEELMDLCEEVFIGEADRLTMEDAAAVAIIESLGDRWSYYIPASQMTDYEEQMSNSYVGVGITIQVREDAQGFDIISVEKSGPAYEAGILPGDVLVGANDVNFLGQTATDASLVIKGEEGTTVDIHIRRDGKEMTFTVERRTIQVTVAEGQMLPGNIGYVTIANFDSRCASETIAAIESLLEQGATALIFDVRYNPGGMPMSWWRCSTTCCPRVSCSSLRIIWATGAWTAPMRIAWNCPWPCWSMATASPPRNSSPLPCGIMNGPPLSVSRPWARATSSRPSTCPTAAP